MAGRPPKTKLPKHYPTKGLFSKRIDGPVDVIEVDVDDSVGAIRAPDEQPVASADDDVQQSEAINIAVPAKKRAKLNLLDHQYACFTNLFEPSATSSSTMTAQPARMKCTICDLHLGTATSLRLNKHGLYTHLLSKSHLKAMELAEAAAVAGVVRHEDVIVALAASRDKHYQQKLTQFAVIYQALASGRPMIMYEEQHELCKYLSISNVHHMHWTGPAGWDIAECIEVLQQKSRAFVENKQVIACSLDESTDAANHSNMVVHMYVVHDWQRVCLFVGLPRVQVAPNAGNITALALNTLATRMGLSTLQLSRRLVMFASDGAAVLQGRQNGVIQRVREQVAPFAQPMHCMAHRVDLSAGSLDKHSIMENTKALLDGIFQFYSHSTTRCEALTSAQKRVSVPVHRITRATPTRWISHYSALDRALEQLVALVAHAVKEEEEDSNAKSIEQMARLTDLERYLGMAIMLPMLKQLNVLVKVLQGSDSYVQHMLDAVSHTVGRIKSLYLDEDYAFTGADFAVLHSFTNVTNTDPARAARSPFKFSDMVGVDTPVVHMRVPHSADVLMSARPRAPAPRSLPCPVDEAAFAHLLRHVQEQAAGAARALVDDLHDRFPPVPLLQSLAIVFPHYWSADTNGEAATELPKCIHELKQHYSRDKEAGKTLVQALLDGQALDDQAADFKRFAKEHAEVAMAGTGTDAENTTRFWRMLSSKPHIVATTSEYFKVGEIGMVMVAGSVEDERGFSAMDFLKNKRRNRLDTHLELCMRAKLQRLFTLQTFPFVDAIDVWKAKDRYGTVIE